MYKFYWGPKAWRCLFSEIGKGRKLGKKLILPVHISVFEEGVMVENVTLLCSFVISCQIQSASLHLFLLAFFVLFDVY